MASFFAEDAAHDAILKILGKSNSDIRISKGRGRVISLTLETDGSIGFIDQDVNVDSRLANVKWKKTDDFEHCIKAGKLFIKFRLNVEEWLYRIANEYKINFSEFSLPETAKECHANQKIVASSHEARRFLTRILNAKDSPLKLLKKVIEGN